MWKISVKLVYEVLQNREKGSLSLLLKDDSVDYLIKHQINYR